MYVNLDVIDYEDDVKELRVNIYESDGTLKPSYTSASEEYNMTILIPSSGNYFMLLTIYMVALIIF